MKYKFNFVQIANWLFICRDNLLKVKEQAIENKISKEEAIQKLESQKRHLLLIKDVINRKIILHGVSREFLAKFKDIKKQYGIEE
jgi:hypothetical protein